MQRDRKFIYDKEFKKFKNEEDYHNNPLRSKTLKIKEAIERLTNHMNRITKGGEGNNAILGRLWREGMEYINNLYN